MDDTNNPTAVGLRATAAQLRDASFKAFVLAMDGALICKPEWRQRVLDRWAADHPVEFFMVRAAAQLQRSAARGQR